MLNGCTEWPEELIQRYREKGYWQDITLNEMLTQSTLVNGDKEAIIYKDQRITYNVLLKLVDRLAYRLLESGLEDRDRVVFQLPNSPELIITFFALIRIGVIPVLALPAHRQTEIAHFIDSSNSVASFIPDIHRKFDYREMMEEMGPQHPCLKQVFVTGETRKDQISLDDLLSAELDESIIKKKLDGIRPDPMDVALMLLSGGTTALPKLIPRTHNDYVYNAKRGGELSGFGGRLSNLMLVLPMSHNYNLIAPGFLGALAHGGKVIIATDHKTESIFSLVQNEKVEFIPAAGPLIVNWLNSDASLKYDISSIKVIANGGARLTPDHRIKLEEQFACIFQEVFGTGEGLINYSMLDDPDEVRFYSSGRPICPDDEIKIVDEKGNEVPNGELGELIVRGPYTIRGYYNAPEKNSTAFTSDGFYRMGDLVRLENDYLYCEGRISDLINRGGEKISCDQVEGLILTNPKVKSVSLIAIPDPVFGEKGCAFVILQPHETMELEELSDHLIRCKIAKFKLPERLVIVDKFPISPAGKILKRELRALVVE